MADTGHTAGQATGDIQFDRAIEQAQKALALCNAALARAEAAEERVRVLTKAADRLRAQVERDAKRGHSPAMLEALHEVEQVIKEPRAALATTGVQHG